jgi:hypothetical protein
MWVWVNLRTLFNPSPRGFLLLLPLDLTHTHTHKYHRERCRWSVYPLISSPLICTVEKVCKECFSLNYLLIL